VPRFPDFIEENHEVHEWRHALAILASGFPSEYADICDVLTRFRIQKSHIVVGGGQKSKVAKWIDDAFSSKGWVEKRFETSITVDEQVMSSPTHAVDCYKPLVRPPFR